MVSRRPAYASSGQCARNLVKGMRRSLNPRSAAPTGAWRCYSDHAVAIASTGDLGVLLLMETIGPRYRERWFEAALGKPEAM